MHTAAATAATNVEVHRIARRALVYDLLRYNKVARALEWHAIAGLYWLRALWVDAASIRIEYDRVAVAVWGGREYRHNERARPFTTPPNCQARNRFKFINVYVCGEITFSLCRYKL